MILTHIIQRSCTTLDPHVYIKEEAEYVNSCWEACIAEKNTLLPAYKIKLFNNVTNKYEEYQLTTLQFFNENPIETNVEIETIPQYKNTNEYSDVTLENSDISDIAKKTNLSIEDSNVDFSLQDLESNQQDLNKTPDQDAPIKYSFTPLNIETKPNNVLQPLKGRQRNQKSLE